MLQCRPAQEFSFGPRALKEALVSSDPTLRRLYASAFTPAERLFLAEAYNPQRTLFCTLLIHTAFDWLLSRPEAPEDFQTFHASLPPRRQSPARKHIYLQPIDLSEGPAGGALLEYLRDCTEAFFLGLQVRCLPSVAAASIHCSSRPSQDSDRLQLHTDGILSFLKSSKPGDALCVLGLTLSDLYPCEAWSFTFGKFLPGHEVGVCSFARFSGELLQPGPGASEAVPVQAAADGPETPVQDPGQTLCFSALGLAQCCKVTCHELCHLLGLGSCRWLGCIMQGALSLEEALRRPLDLCPICLRKLQHVLGFKLIDRYKRLYAWTRAGSRPDADAGAPSASDETLPCSADSGLSCDSGSEPLTPDTWSHTFSAGPEPEPEEGLGSPAAPDSPSGCGPAVDAIREHGRWLERCIRALEREVTEEELAQVDGAVEALAGWEMFTGRLPAPRQDPPCGRDGSGLRRVLGDRFSSLRRKLSTRKLSKAGSSPGRWREERN
ncbi:archaemetzincin-1 isoform X1 [Herpailurus yagouaroundi]|uniref:archaemetzincin-1 isoform X1 n=1 Tax=Herpailurus yagouaroundi TaxID=1608482 RepID=UPI001AD60970|nr:archaemetzincin-1 isoform X1 [Puma yagouaroundi]XP_040311691.1 archaemetzincin-1 isoform X1 [Puma yagouaroundi]XP_040311692.1 archaemetzincin-1 isoform X1 [Puma yagouaroundi]XP_040311694.1 archaemetzincin-1 isoform X1 [Puma yagouaroundi]